MEKQRITVIGRVFTNLSGGKYIVLFLLLTIFLVFYLVSCRDEGTSITNPVYKSFVNPYDEVGKIHNEGLDYCLNYMKVHSVSVKSKDDLLLFANEGISKFIKEKGITISAEVYDNTMNFVKDFISNPKADKKLRKIANNGLLDLEYTERQNSYFNRLFGLFQSCSSMEILKDSINYISFEATQVFTETEARPILVTSSVMLNSLEYWYTHTEELYKLAESLIGKKLNKIKLEPINWLEVGEVDAYAAAASIIPCIGAAVGWGACVGGAALGASMLNATIQLINYIIETYYGG